MNRHALRSLSAISFVGVTAIGITLGAGIAPASAEDCSSTCFVGGAGTGGTSSDGAAQGFHYQKPAPSIPGSTVTNSGNQMAGNITLTGTESGMAAGAYTPQGVGVGHYEGTVAGWFGIDGTCNGVCV